MEKSHVVFGPQGCGKSRSANRIAKHFGLSKVEDADDALFNPKYAQTDTLYLTNLTREEIEAQCPGARRVSAFADLPAHLKV